MLRKRKEEGNRVHINIMAKKPRRAGKEIEDK